MKHGYVQYNKGCRCFTCRLGKHEYEKNHVTGGVLLVDAGPAREHLAALRASGFGLKRIEHATGIGRATLSRLAHAAGPTIRQTTAERLLAFRPVELSPPRRYVHALGTHRRIQALCTLGWPPAQQVAMAGLAETGSTRLLPMDQVWPATAEKIGALYERLSMTIAPPSRFATKARNRARRELFFPPLAWDDEAIDDPAALPCILPPVAPVDTGLELLVQHLAAGHPVEPTTAAIREVIRRMPEAKPAELALVVRRPAKTVADLRSRMRAS